MRKGFIISHELQAESFNFICLNPSEKGHGFSCLSFVCIFLNYLFIETLFGMLSVPWSCKWFSLAQLFLGLIGLGEAMLSASSQCPCGSWSWNPVELHPRVQCELLTSKRLQGLAPLSAVGCGHKSPDCSARTLCKVASAQFLMHAMGACGHTDCP